MTGGYTLIQLKDRSTNRPLNVTGTTTAVTVGTFAKIKRAINLQKQIRFSDFTILDQKFNPGSNLTFYGLYVISGHDVIIFEITYITVGGTIVRATLNFDDTDVCRLAIPE